MRKNILFIICCFFITHVHAQAFETTLKMGKVNEPVIAIDYSYNLETVALALRNKFSNYEASPKQNGDWTEFYNVPLTEIIQSPLNYLFKLEAASGKQAKTRVYLIMRSDNEITEDPSNIATNAKTFLNQLTQLMIRINSIKDLKKQEQLLIEEELKLENIKKQYAELEAKMRENEQAQAKQARIVASQKKMVEDIKSKL
ncbi:MAG: hypothetical protein E6Q95_02900 [Chitinophagaceae bacterium]|nr:MAG: hypothetical protein E6Q95_02900 [Chitinophagaceae bacterium]